MRQYIGWRLTTGEAMTDVLNDEGDRWPLDPRYEVVNHSPDGFEWGYAGSGPAQLAFAILADAFNEDIAKQCYQWFKTKVIERLERDSGWVMSDTVVRSILLSDPASKNIIIASGRSR